MPTAAAAAASTAAAASPNETSTSASVVMSEGDETAKEGMDAGGDSGAAAKMPSPMLASESGASGASLSSRVGAKVEPAETSPTPPPPMPMPPPLFQSLSCPTDSSASSLISALLPVPGQPAATAEETVTIALDEVMQFAQPTVVTEYY